jgi:hypothetical protein
VTTTSYRQIEATPASEVHRVSDVGGAQAARDQRGPPVNHAVVNFSSIVIPGFTGEQNHARETSREVGDTCLIE